MKIRSASFVLLRHAGRQTVEPNRRIFFPKILVANDPILAI